MPEFTEEKGLVLSSKRLGERSCILSVLTEKNGRYLGVYQKQKPPEIGTLVSVRWRARLAEQMGTFYLEEVTSFSIPFLDDKKRLACLLSICLLLHELLPERQIFSDLYHSVLDFLNDLSKTDFFKKYVLLEKELLGEIGFGLDTSCCAGGGNSDDLFYVSPKTGRAVSREKGRPYHDKLLLLPRFLWCNSEATDLDIQLGLKLTGYFLQTFALKKMLPKIREQLMVL